MGNLTRTECRATCDTCLECDRGCDYCDSCESLCQTGSQVVGGFSFSGCYDKGEFIGDFTSSWNDLCDYINEAYAVGNKQNGGTPSCTKRKAGDVLYASDFNALARDLSGLGGPGTSTRVGINSVIYGSYFEDLEKAADELLYSNRQCDQPCNTSCQICLNCLRCNTCNGQNAYSISYCCSCNTSCDTGQTPASGGGK